MPRTKGSKNRIRETTVEERITAVETEIQKLTEALKVKKTELKNLVKEKAKAERIAAEKKLEEEKAAIMDAVKKSGKSVDEILDFLKK